MWTEAGIEVLGVAGAALCAWIWVPVKQCVPFVETLQEST